MPIKSMTFINFLRDKLGLRNNKKVMVLYNLGLTPNRATIIAIFFKLLMLYFLFIGNIVFAGITLLAVYLFDGLDGMIARASGNVTKFGSILDKGTDFFLIRSGYFLLAYNGFLSYNLAITTILIVFFTPLFLQFMDRLNVKRNKSLPSWGDTILIFFALFTGKVELFFYLMIGLSIILFIINIIVIIYLNLIKKK